MEFYNRSSQSYKEETEKVKCPLCGKAKVTVTYIPGYMSYKTTRIAAGSKLVRHYHDPKVKPHSSCPECKATKQDIKEALETGITKKQSHEDLLKRLKEAGLPTKIESKRKE